MRRRCVASILVILLVAKDSAPRRSSTSSAGLRNPFLQHLAAENFIRKDVWSLLHPCCSEQVPPKRNCSTESFPQAFCILLLAWSILIWSSGPGSESFVFLACVRLASTCLFMPQLLHRCWPFVRDIKNARKASWGDLDDLVIESSDAVRQSANPSTFMYLVEPSRKWAQVITTMLRITFDSGHVAILCCYQALGSTTVLLWTMWDSQTLRNLHLTE